LVSLEGRSYSTATYAGRWHDGVYMSNKEKRKGEESMSGVYHFHHSTLRCSNFVAKSGP